MPKKYLDQIVVVDLEATCWETEEESAKNTSEIIEIGVCFYDVQRKVPWKPHCPKCQGRQGEEECQICQGTGYVGSIIVRPTVSKISEFCTKLTSLTPEFVRKYGLDFPSGINRLRKFYGPKTKIWGSWGDYDRRMISDHCERYQEKYPFGATHWNIKSMHGVKKKLHREIGLEMAIRMAGFDFKGSHHRGGDDAYNTARLLPEIIG